MNTKFKKKMKSVEDSLGIWNAGLIWIHDKKDAGTAELERARNINNFNRDKRPKVGQWFPDKNSNYEGSVKASVQISSREQNLRQD